MAELMTSSDTHDKSKEVLQEVLKNLGIDVDYFQTPYARDAAKVIESLLDEVIESYAEHLSDLEETVTELRDELKELKVEG